MEIFEDGKLFAIPDTEILSGLEYSTSGQIICQYLKNTTTPHIAPHLHFTSGSQDGEICKTLA